MKAENTRSNVGALACPGRNRSVGYEVGGAAELRSARQARRPALLGNGYCRAFNPAPGQNCGIGDKGLNTRAALATDGRHYWQEAIGDRTTASRS
jgi:hypothetical protein